MRCECNDNKKLAEIRVVQGNLLRLAIPLTLRTLALDDGEVVVNDTDFIPSSSYPVRVEFSDRKVKVAFDAAMRGNVAYIEDAGTIPVGTYAITVLCKDDNGHPYRFKQRTVLSVVDVTADAGVTTPIEFETQVWYLDAALFLAMRGEDGEDGEDGVGIDDIQTESSSEIGGVNTVKIILTDGRTRTFTVLNGSGSVDSEFDLGSLHPLTNRAVTQRFNAVSQDLAGTIGDVDYDSTKREIRFWNKDKTLVVAILDATPFVRDESISNVYTSNNMLVITFNTGRSPITLPLSSIFNPNNYYTKSQTDNRIAIALANVNMANYYTKSEVDALASGKMSVNDYVDNNTLRIKANRTTRIVLDYIVGDGEQIEYEMSAGLMWYKNGQVWFAKQGDADIETVSLGAPNTGIVYVNAEDNKMYRWDGRTWQQVGGSSGGGGTLTQVQADWGESDTTNAAYIRNKPTIPVVPTNVSAFMNDADYQSGQQVNDALLNKVDKVAGKQLSTEDYTSAEKTKLAGLSNYDDTALRNAINSLQSAIDAITSGDTTTAIETFQEVIDFLDGVTDDATLIGKLNELRALINAKYTKPSTGIPASDLASGVIPDVSGKQDTLVSGDNIKTVNGVSILGAGDIDTSQITYGKFDDNNRTAFLPAIAYNPITDTWIFGETPVTLASQMIYMDVTTDKHYMYVGKNLVEVGGVSGLATVATSGSYNDLKDKPTIPTVPSNVSAFTNDAGYLTQHQDISGKADKVTVVDVSSTGDVSQALAPNTFYRFGTIDSLALTLTSGTGFVMYAGKFTASSDWGGTELSVPASVTEASGNDTVEAGKVYEFSILDNIIVVKEV